MNFTTHKMTTKIGLMAIMLVAALLGATTVTAQELYGTLNGTVTDKSGAVVPKLTVTLTNQGTGEVRTVVTNEVGEYRFGDVLPGTYVVGVPRTGNFAAFNENGVGVAGLRFCRSV